MHVTLRVLDDVPSLRKKQRFVAIRECIRVARERFQMRVIQFCVMGNHIHLIVEPDNKKSLSKGMQGLAIRVAKAINGRTREGKVFRDRYHAVVMETPKEVRATLAYVMLNARKHARASFRARRFDPCSSAYWFDGWATDVESLRRRTLDLLEMGDPPVVRARTSLLRVAWRAHRLIDPSERPGPPDAPPPPT